MGKKSEEPNRWKGIVLGAVGGLVGVAAMAQYWKVATAVTGEDPRAATKEKGAEPGLLDNISLVGKQYKDGEASTEALGRIIYKKFTGKEPRSKETKNTLSYLVHWVFSMIPAGTYGAVRGSVTIPDIPGGIALGAGLWLMGDELGVPMLGLAAGPTTFPAKMHVHTFGAHIVYGLTSAAATQVLNKIL